MSWNTVKPFTYLFRKAPSKTAPHTRNWPRLIREHAYFTCCGVTCKLISLLSSSSRQNGLALSLYIAFLKLHVRLLACSKLLDVESASLAKAFYCFPMLMFSPDFIFRYASKVLDLFFWLSQTFERCFQMMHPLRKLLRLVEEAYKPLKKPYVGCGIRSQTFQRFFFSLILFRGSDNNLPASCYAQFKDLTSITSIQFFMSRLQSTSMLVAVHSLNISNMRSRITSHPAPKCLKRFIQVIVWSDKRYENLSLNIMLLFAGPVITADMTESNYVVCCVPAISTEFNYRINFSFSMLVRVF